MKIAFATKGGEYVDEHFGRTTCFAVYEIDKEQIKFLENRACKGKGEEEKDKVMPRITTVEDCKIVYIQAIGGPAAAKLINLKIHPIKVKKPEVISELLHKFREVLRGNPPLWLKKALV